MKKGNVYINYGRDLLEKTYHKGLDLKELMVGLRLLEKVFVQEKVSECKDSIGLIKSIKK